MDIHIHIHHHDRSYDEILKRLNQIQMGQAELAADIVGITAQIGKIGTEVSGLKDKIADLENNLPAEVTPELQAAVDALKAQVQVVDDLVPDTSNPPVTEG